MYEYNPKNHKNILFFVLWTVIGSQNGIIVYKQVEAKEKHKGI